MTNFYMCSITSCAHSSAGGITPMNHLPSRSGSPATGPGLSTEHSSICSWRYDVIFLHTLLYSRCYEVRYSWISIIPFNQSYLRYTFSVILSVLSKNQNIRTDIFLNHLPNLPHPIHLRVQDFERANTQRVRQLFNSVDELLYEGTVSSRSESLQDECEEWNSRTPHLRSQKH